MNEVLPKSALVSLLYLLMRDAAPTGEVVRIVRMLKGKIGEENRYTSPELQAYAERLADEMLS